MAGKAWTLFGPDKKIYSEIIKAINGEKYLTFDFTERDRETFIIAYALAKIQKTNYSLWKKIYMLCIEEFFRCTDCISPPNWSGIVTKFHDQIAPYIEEGKCVCISDDKFETECNYPAYELDIEYDSAVFLSESGKRFFVSYKTEKRYPTRDSFIKYGEEYELEKIYFLKSDNLKGNICVAHHIELKDFRRIAESVGVDIISPWDSVTETKKQIRKQMVIKCPNPY